MKKILSLFISFCLLSVTAAVAHADAVTDNALNYLKSKQGATGQITAGSFSDASPWAGIAFGAYGITLDSVKNPTVSLADYLATNQPATTSAAFEWEKSILAIVAGGFNPYDFGGIDYVTTLKSAPYYNANQIGDTSGVNDDWFGVMALVAGKVDVSDPALNDAVAFIIANQNSDGGWGYAPGVDSDSNDTAAAIQGLVAAKDYGVSSANLDGAITQAKVYLLSLQDVSGGFLYDTMPWTTDPDSNSTSWALMALNVLGMKDSSEGTAARSWLISQQSAVDGGFTALDWGTFTFVSNSSITADSLVALSGKGWVVKIFDPAAVATLSATPTVTPSPTVTPTPTSSNNSPTSTPTPTPTSQPVAETTLASLLSSPLVIQETEQEENIIDELSITPSPSVLGVADENEQNASENNTKGILIARIFAGLGVIFIFIYLAKPFIIRRFK